MKCSNIIISCSVSEGESLRCRSVLEGTKFNDPKNLFKKRNLRPNGVLLEPFYDTDSQEEDSVEFEERRKRGKMKRLTTGRRDTINRWKLSKDVPDWQKKEEQTEVMTKFQAEIERAGNVLRGKASKGTLATYAGRLFTFETSYFRWVRRVHNETWEPHMFLVGKNGEPPKMRARDPRPWIDTIAEGHKGNKSDLARSMRNSYNR